MEFQRVRNIGLIVLSFTVIIVLLITGNDKSIKNNNYIAFGVDFSQWYSEQDAGSIPYYSALLFADGNYSGYSMETDKNALECFANLEIGEKVDDKTIVKATGHLIDFSIVDADENGDTFVSESYTVLFDADYRYVTLAYNQDETGIYKVLNSDTVKKYFGQ